MRRWEPARRWETVPDVYWIPVTVIDTTAEVVLAVLKHTGGRPAAMFRQYFFTRPSPPAGPERRLKKWVRM